MTHRFLIALGAGILTAVVFVSAALGHPVAAAPFFLLTPLAIFLAGLALGWRTAAAAGTIATLLIAAVSNPTTGLIFAASLVVPAVLLIYLALLHRPALAPAGTTEAVEWYPPGRLVIAAALVAAILSTASMFMLGGTRDALRAKVAPAVETMVKGLLAEIPDPGALAESDIPQLTEYAVTLLPAAAAILPLAALLFNLWLAGRITRASGQLARPWPDLAAIEFPRGSALALAGTTFAATADGMPGLAATALSGTLFVAYVLLGLAVIHFVTRGAAWRPFALWVLYAALLLVSGGVTLIVAIVGVIDGAWPLRRAPPS